MELLPTTPSGPTAPAPLPTTPQNMPTPAHTGLYGWVFTSILSMAMGLGLLLLVTLVYRHATELPIFWQKPEPLKHHYFWEAVLGCGYVALGLFAGGVMMLLRMKFSRPWLMAHGLGCFGVLSIVTLINLLLIATNVRELDMELILYTALLAAMAGLGFLVARNAWADQV